MSNLVTLRNKLALDLSNNSIVVDSANRAVERAVADLSRILPRRRLYSVRTNWQKEFTITGTPNELTVGTGVKFWKPKSESIEGLTRTEDYTVDYANGIVSIPAGKLQSGTSYKLTYSIVQIAVDISDIMDSMLRLRQVEYPAGRVPQSFADFEVDGDLLIIKSREIITGQGDARDVQADLDSDEYVWVYYDELHTVPTETDDGSYSTALDDTVVKGAGYYLLYAEALDSLRQANDELTSLVSTDADSLLNSAQRSVSRADTGEDDTLLDNAETALDGIATGVTAIGEALDALNYQPLLDELTAVASALTTAANVWDDEKKWLETTGGHNDANAQSHLDVGTELINKITPGERAAQTRADFARTSIEAALVYDQRWKNNISMLNVRVGIVNALLVEINSYLEQARITVAQGNLRVQESQLRLSIMESKIATEVSIVDRRVAIAERLLTTGRSKLEQALVLRDEFFAELENRLTGLRSVPSLPI